MNVFVCCSAEENIEKKYKDVAFELANILNECNCNLIFGGSNTGLMGVLYNNVKSSYAYAPKVYENALNVLNCTKYLDDSILKITEKMINDADIIIILPGGFGTLFELFSVIHMKKSKEMNKKIIIVNSYNYYDNLLAMFDSIYDQNFANIMSKDLYEIVQTTDSIKNFLN